MTAKELGPCARPVHLEMPQLPFSITHSLIPLTQNCTEISLTLARALGQFGATCPPDERCPGGLRELPLRPEAQMSLPSLYTTMSGSLRPTCRESGSRTHPGQTPSIQILPADSSFCACQACQGHPVMRGIAGTHMLPSSQWSFDQGAASQTPTTTAALLLRSGTYLGFHEGWGKCLTLSVPQQNEINIRTCLTL